jgi:hypothetical protein
MIAYNDIVAQHIGLEEGLQVLENISAPAAHLCKRHSKSDSEGVRPILNR